MDPTRSTWTSLARRIAVFALLGTALLAAPARAAAPQALPPQGVYDQCGPALSGVQECLDRLDRIHAAGFRVVLNYTLWYSSASDLKAYLDHAQSLGMKVIAPMNYTAWRDGSTSLS